MANPPPMIELCHLRYFIAASEYGGFRKAGASVFNRHNCAVCLTLAT
ncbi:hypothetical protein [Phyllobacterium myrsinacearum]|uniref:Uncharacterized protein n=1 Tax=Phyllobacterium myrsinacearum TaxID=28101 RepID=A0A839EM48_9HYPH|nr:hypothetical protein [Phyllobacterium myrsinacearum]MBA8879285.1 hypothetical protein [Phyllobacterium myrsinacearum]